MNNLEFVKTPNAIRQDRIYDAHWKLYNPLRTSDMHKFSSKKTASCNICVIANNNMDGQKIIWLQQLHHLTTSEHIFNFTFFLMINMEDSRETFYYHLKLYNATVFSYPLSTYNEITMQVLEEDPLDGTLPIAKYWVITCIINISLVYYIFMLLLYRRKEI